MLNPQQASLHTCLSQRIPPPYASKKIFVPWFKPSHGLLDTRASLQTALVPPHRENSLQLRSLWDGQGLWRAPCRETGSRHECELKSVRFSSFSSFFRGKNQSTSAFTEVPALGFLLGSKTWIKLLAPFLIQLDLYPSGLFFLLKPQIL